MHTRCAHRSAFPVSTLRIVVGVVVAACAGGGERPAGDTASGAAPATPPATGAQAGVGQITPQLIALGDSIFEGKAAGGICYTCHGPEGQGTQLGPNLTDQQWLHGDGSYEFIVRNVSTGVPTPKQYPGPMPPFGQTLTPEQIRAVAAYVYSLSHPSG
jgi:mono/diheme cytochrome c family protein